VQQRKLTLFKQDVRAPASPRTLFIIKMVEKTYGGIGYQLTTTWAEAQGILKM